MFSQRLMSLFVLGCLAGGVCADPLPVSPSVEQWIEWGKVVHGGFGSHIALGIRMGQDAMTQLKAERRELIVTVTTGANAPCACVADGITIATSASAGQRSMQVQAPSEDTRFIALVVFQKRNERTRILYRIPSSAASTLAAMNAEHTPEQRYRRVMSAPQEQLYTVEVQEK
jgi:formylmethanofuran dehydrogenase subunit E